MREPFHTLSRREHAMASALVAAEAALSEALRGHLYSLRGALVLTEIRTALHATQQKDCQHA